jgi:hypothetical protein
LLNSRASTARLFAAAFAGNMTNNSLCLSFGPCQSSCREQFQEKCETVFRPELRHNKELEQFAVSVKR